MKNSSIHSLPSKTVSASCVYIVCVCVCVHICPSTDEWMEKMWYIETMEYYSAIKRNEIGSFAVMCMDLDYVIQSEISQKEKNKYCILMHLCGIQKNGTNEPICRAGIQMQMQRTAVWTQGGHRMSWEIGIAVSVPACVKQTASREAAAYHRGLRLCSEVTQMVGRAGHEGRDIGTHRTDSQHCKAIMRACMLDCSVMSNSL